MRRHSAVVHDGTTETVEADLAVMPRRVRVGLVRQLAEGERIVIRTRQHPGVLWRPVAWVLGALVVYGWLDAGVHASRQVLTLALLALAIAVGRLVWAEVQRRFRWIIVTNKRILKREGVLDLSVPMMRLTKVTDMTYRRSMLGELTGFGTIIIESAGQQQAIRELTYLPDPDDVNAALNSEIFGEKPRRRSRTKGRSWPRIRPRGRRGPEGDGGGGDGDGGRGGPPRGRGPGPRDNGPVGADGGVDVSGSGHPAPPRTRPETWYRSSNLGSPRHLGDTGEIPAVSVQDVERWRAAGRPGRREEPFDQDADPFASWDESAPVRGARGGADDGYDPQAVREIPLYPPTDWVDRR